MFVIHYSTVMLFMSVQDLLFLFSTTVPDLGQTFKKDIPLF